MDYWKEYARKYGKRRRECHMVGQKDSLDDIAGLCKYARMVARQLDRPTRDCFLQSKSESLPKPLDAKHVRTKDTFQVHLLQERIARLAALRAKNESIFQELRRRKDKKELPSDCAAKIEANVNQPDDFQIIERFDIVFTSKDLRTLRHPNWLNDEVINFYMELLAERSKGKIFAMSTFFYPKLKNHGYAGVQRWTRKIDLFSYQMILIPIHLGMHWCLSVVDMAKKHLCYYDSLLGGDRGCLQRLKSYLEHEHLDKRMQELKGDWSMTVDRNIPEQRNGYDCGVFACVFAEHISRNGGFSFDQQDMLYYRSRISYEIITGRLLFM